MRHLTLILLAVMVLFAVGCDYTKEHHKSLAVVHSPGISSHNVSIPYALLGEELSGIYVWYSTDGHFWFRATRGWGGEGEMGLTTSVVGESYTWSWDSLADIGPVLSLNVMIKMVPWGRGKGIGDMSPVFIVNNTINTRPTAIILSSWNPATPESGDLAVEYGVADAESDALRATLQFSVDGGANFFDARLVGDIASMPVEKLESTFPVEANDNGNQLSLWNLPGLDLGTNTDAAGKLYVELTDSGGQRTVELFSDSSKSSLVARGTLTGNGTVPLSDRNSSGLAGSVGAEANDGSYQLSSWILLGLSKGSNTDANGKIYVDLTSTTVSLYSDSAKTSLVAQGTFAGAGTVTLAEQSSSGMTGSVDVAYSADDSDIELVCAWGSVAVAYSGDDLDIELTCYKSYTGTGAMMWDTLLDIGPNYQPDVRLRVELYDGDVIRSTTLGTTPSYTPDTSQEEQLSIDNTGL